MATIINKSVSFPDARLATSCPSYDNFVEETFGGHEMKDKDDTEMTVSAFSVQRESLENGGLNTRFGATIGIYYYEVCGAYRELSTASVNFTASKREIPARHRPLFINRNSFAN